MFTSKLEHIFTKENLKEAFYDVSQTSKGIDEISYKSFKQNSSSNIKNLIDELLCGKYSPEPLKKIEIKKNENETRPIALSSIKDKIIQRCLYHSLNLYFDKIFSDKSYAYRKDKSVGKAVNRTTQFIQKKYHFVLKTDIDNFFEQICHEKLLKLLEKQISDKRIIKLIALFLKTGSFKVFNYHEHYEGVHQGDILAPLLSNIYLNEMDKFLERYKIPFVRYADDFVVFTKKEKEALSVQKNLKSFLKALNLNLQEKKTYIRHISQGFVFLGVHFEGKNRFIENERLQKSISKLHKISRNRSGFKKFIDEVNDYLKSLKNHYLKIIQKNSNQHQLLKVEFLGALSQKVFLCKTNKEIKTKKEFRILLSQINFEILFHDEVLKDKHELIIAKAYEKYLANKSYNSQAKIDKKKNQYAKKFANDTTLHINEPGLNIGISKNKFAIKKYGKVQKTYPIEKVKRIILEGKGLSFSSNLLERCVKENITIDFINRDFLPFASLISYKASTTQLINKQAMLLNTPFQIKVAKEFIKGKAKNQINYLKYLNKYHKLLDENISSMQNLLKDIKSKVNTTNELMGFEGSISVLYWSSLRLIIEVPFEKRITFGAKDIVNSSLNYAYAILYGKIQESLVQSGLALNISFLHALDNTKPTLTFDMIEEFRTFIVDRTIISMINKNEPIKLDNKGLLTKESRKLISKNIKEKLGSYTMWKKQSIKCEHIILNQSYALANCINDKNKKYKAFIGKY